MPLNLRKKKKNPEMESLLTQMPPLASQEFIQKIDIKDTLLQQTNKSISKQYSNYNHVNWRLSSHLHDALEELLQESETSMPIDGKPDSRITWRRILNLITGPF